MDKLKKIKVIEIAKNDEKLYDLVDILETGYKSSDLDSFYEKWIRKFNKEV